MVPQQSYYHPQLVHQSQHQSLHHQHYQQQQHEQQQQQQHQQQQQQHQHHHHHHHHNQYKTEPTASQTTASKHHNDKAPSSQPQHDELMETLMILVQNNQQNEELLKESCEMSQNFTIQLQERGRLMANITYQENLPQPDSCSLDKAKRDLNECENLLKERATELNKLRNRLLLEQQEIFRQMTDVQNSILCEHLPNWHLEQQLANNGTVSDNGSLDRIQIWVEMLTDITWRLRNQLKVLHHSIASKRGVRFNLDELNQFGLMIDKSLEALILNTFVVEKQPPQVMKTNTRFTSTVRFLSGTKLNVQMINPTVKVTILSENNARAVIKRHREIIKSSWSYLDCSSPDTTNNQASQSQQHMSNTLGLVGHHIPQAHSSSQQQQLNYSNLVGESPHQAAATGVLSTHNAAPQPPPPSHQIIQQHQALTPQHQVKQQQQHHHHHHHHQQQQFFQQHHPPQQFHAQAPLPPIPQQQQQIPQSSMAAHQYQGQHLQPEIPFYPMKILNMNEFDSSGEILNNSNILEYQESTRQLVCHFRNMQLKKIKRTEKKGTESVMDEKFVLLFHTEFRIAETRSVDSSSSNLSKSSTWMKQGDLSFHIMAFSLPVVVIVHGNQEPHAWATVTWHNAFARPDDLLYVVPDKVRWQDLGQVLSDKFRSYAGRGLNGRNLDYLGSKICRIRTDSANDAIVSWNQFSKEPLPEKSFTFWEWFHSILKLTKEHLRELWSADRIYGFLDKKGCVELLSGNAYHEPAPSGTFLLRYSETELGGITIAFVGSDPDQQTVATKNECYHPILQRQSPTNSATTDIKHLLPFVSKDLNTRTLADRISDLADLVYLYPDVPKDDAFNRYYTPLNDITPLSNGYIKPWLVQTLLTNHPKSQASNAMECSNTPTTPNSFSQSSPDGIYQDNAFISDMDSSLPQNYDSIPMNEFNQTIQ